MDINGGRMNVNVNKFDVRVNISSPRYVVLEFVFSRSKHFRYLLDCF